MQIRWHKHGLMAPLCVLLAACQTAPQNASLQCGAGGAVGAYAVCKMFGGKDSDCAKWAVVGGGVGAVACYTYATNLDKRRKELAGHENDLDRRIQYVRGLNEDTQELNADLTKRVADSRKRTDQLVAQIRQNQVPQQQVAKERAERDEQVKAAEAQVDVGNRALAEVKTFRSQRSGNSAPLDAAITRQEQLLAQAQQQVEQLAAQRARI
jgi:hypothetical protein